MGSPETRQRDDQRLAFREAAQERAAILEFDAGLPRAEAERLARDMTLKEFHGPRAR